MAECQVQILMGSDSDAPTMQRAVDVLRDLGISCHMPYDGCVCAPVARPSPTTRGSRTQPGCQGVHRRSRRGRSSRWRRCRAFDATRHRCAHRFVPSKRVGCASGHRSDAARCSCRDGVGRRGGSHERGCTGRSDSRRCRREHCSRPHRVQAEARSQSRAGCCEGRAVVTVIREGLAFRVRNTQLFGRIAV